MQIVIDIPKSKIPKRQGIIEIPLHFVDGIVCKAGECAFDVLPKRHGRLVDGDALLAALEEDISKQTRHMELLESVGDMKSYFYISKVQIGMVSCKRVLDNAPTIIEADKAGRDG